MLKSTVAVFTFFCFTNFIVVQCFISKQSHPYFTLPRGNNWWTAFGGSDDHAGYKPDTLGPIAGMHERWNVTVSGHLTSPIIYNKTVFITTDTGVLHAFQETTGKSTNLLNIGGQYFMGPPTIGYNGLLYVQIVGSLEGIKLYAIDINNLHILWSATGMSQWATYPYGVASSKTNELVYFPGGAFNGVMYAVNTSNGHSKFASQLYDSGFGCDDWTPSVYKDKRVFFSTGPGEGNDAMIGEVDATSGHVLWKYTLNSDWLGYSTYWVPVVSNGIAFATVFAQGPYISLAAIDVTSHLPLWTTDTCPTISGKDVTPATDGNHVFLTCIDGVHSFNALTGKPEVTYVPCNNCYGQPIITNDYLFVKSDSGVQVFDRKSAALVAKSAVHGDMAYHGGWLFVANGSTLHAYELTS